MKEVVTVPNPRVMTVVDPMTVMTVDPVTVLMKEVDPMMDPNMRMDPRMVELGNLVELKVNMNLITT